MDPMITRTELRTLMTYDPVTGRFRWTTPRGSAKVGDLVGALDKEGYRRVRISRRSYYEHRLVWLWHHGEFPRILDHIDRDRANNRIENLRECHESQNAANAKRCSLNTSGYKGVYFDVDRGKWVARIRFTDSSGVRHRYRIGRFESAEMAAIQYNLHMRRLHPDFALLNKIPGPLGQIFGMA